MKNCIIIILSIVSFVSADTEASAQKSIVSSKIALMINELLASNTGSTDPIPVAILDFAVTDGKAKVQQLGKASAMLMQEAIGKDTRFVLVEREKLGSIMDEIALGQSGIIDEDKAKQAGEMLGVHMIITGTIAEIGTHFIISARLIDVGTGKIIANSAAEIRQENMLAVSSQYVVVKKYAITPAIQSLILPGWGQIYNDQPGKGAMFAVLGLASGATFGLSYLMYQNINYDRADSREAAEAEYKKWSDYHKINQLTLATSVAIWGIAVLDAFIVARKNLKSYSTEEPVASVTFYNNKLGAELSLKF